MTVVSLGLLQHQILNKGNYFLPLQIEELS